MTRTIRIDESRCDGCGICIGVCHEGALELKDGKASVTKGWLCDGIGDCLPACPMNAISFIDVPDANASISIEGPQWPIKLELVSERNPSFDGKHLLIAADCSAFTRPSIMNEYGRDGVRIIACPKLGNVDEGKLSAIMEKNDIRSVDIIRMEVPCCGPLAMRTIEAVKSSGKDIAVNTVILARDGSIRR